MQERNGGREMVGTVLDLHWKNEKKQNKTKKKQGRLDFCRALLFECPELTNILVAITCNGGGQKVK